MVSTLSDLLGWEGEAVGERGSGGVECEALEGVWAVHRDLVLSVIEKGEFGGVKSR